MQEQTIIEGKLWNDPYVKSIHNWIFTENETKKVFKVNESQTEAINNMALKNPHFYISNFKAVKETGFVCEIIL